MTELTEADLVHWQQSQNRVAGYLTTNGMIEITLCGLFATTAAVLVAIGQSRTDPASRDAIFIFILPVFALVVLSLSATVYSWIMMQIEYFAATGIHPSKLKTRPTYEEFKGLVAKKWEEQKRWRRRILLLKKSAKMFVLLPFRVTDIYCCYFLLYIGTAIGSITYGILDNISIWYIMLCMIPYFVFFVFGVQDAIKLEVVRDEVRSRVIRPENLKKGG